MPAAVVVVGVVTTGVVEIGFEKTGEKEPELLLLWSLLWLEPLLLEPLLLSVAKETGEKAKAANATKQSVVNEDFMRESPFEIESYHRFAWRTSLQPKCHDFDLPA